MSSAFRSSRLLVVGVTCAGIGAGASAIATAGAATPSRAASSHPAAARAGLVGRFARRAVSGDVVVRTKSGFATVTFERGRVDSVTGDRLTLTEGTPKASYRTVTLTIPSSAIVRDNRARTSLSSLTAGQRVLVLAGPRRTRVIAHTARSAAS